MNIFFLNGADIHHYYRQEVGKECTASVRVKEIDTQPQERKSRGKVGMYVCVACCFDIASHGPHSLEYVNTIPRFVLEIMCCFINLNALLIYISPSLPQNARIPSART